MDRIDFAVAADGKTMGLPLRFANRHGLVTGATGTGKTVSLQTLMEGFSAAGVPVFAADIKGDLSGIAAEGDPSGKAAKRAADLGRGFTPNKFPVRFWDVKRTHGLPIRTSVHRMGATLIGRMLNLNQTQEGTLAIAFKREGDQQSAFLDLDALRWQMVDMLDNRADICEQYGNITAASISTIQREILALESQGAADLFGEPALDIADFMKTDDNGRGVINLLHADSLMEVPKLYACLLLWLLTELFRVLPEAGDLAMPKLVFLFDEAHLLFRDAPAKLIETVERVVRLVRSKGVGVYFVTQSPADVPNAVLAQLGNRIQHALRAYTPADQRMVKAAAKAFRPNKAVNVMDAITSMGVGEALVSFLVEDGVPAPVERCKVIPPSAQIGPISDIEREIMVSSDTLATKYQVTRTPQGQHRDLLNRIRAEKGQEPIPEPESEWNPEEVNDYIPVFDFGDYAPPPRKPFLSPVEKFWFGIFGLMIVVGLSFA